MHPMEPLLANNHRITEYWCRSATSYGTNNESLRLAIDITGVQI